MKATYTLALSGISAMALLLGGPDIASAGDDDRFRVDVRVGWTYNPGHWEERSERYVVREGYWTQRYVQPPPRVVYDECGRRKTIVYDGYYERAWVEPVYGTRTVRTYVEGCWNKCDPAPQPKVGISFDFGYRWGGDRHDNDRHDGDRDHGRGGGGRRDYRH